MVFAENLTIKTKKKVDLVNITEAVQAAVDRSKIKEGIVALFTTHTTAGIFINEDEANLLTDIESTLRELFDKGVYLHNRIDNNAEAHIKAIFLGSDKVISLSNGKLDLGTWQRVFFSEFDGPRTRAVKIKIVGE